MKFSDISVPDHCPSTPEQIWRARAAIKAHAIDDHDEQHLLTMIGIIPDPLARDRADVRREDVLAAKKRREGDTR